MRGTTRRAPGPAESRIRLRRSAEPVLRRIAEAEGVRRHQLRSLEERGFRRRRSRPRPQCPRGSLRGYPAGCRRACARPPARDAPISPSRGPTPKCSANASSLNDPTAFLSSRLRASGSVSTKRQSSGSSRPSRRYSACRNPASNCRVVRGEKHRSAAAVFPRLHHELLQKFSRTRERRHRGRGHHRIRDSRQRHDGGGNVESPRIHQRRHGRLRRVRRVHRRELDDPVPIFAQTRRLKIEHHNHGHLRRSLRRRDAGLERRGAISAADSVAFEEDAGAPGPAPGEPHADRPGAMRRCVALSARWRRSGVVA